MENFKEFEIEFEIEFQKKFQEYSGIDPNYDYYDPNYHAGSIKNVFFPANLPDAGSYRSDA